MIVSSAQPARERAGWLRALERAAAAPDRGRFWLWLDEALDPGAWRPRRALEVEVRDFGSRRFGTSYVLKNERAGTYARLTPEEHFVWERLDGRSVRELLADYLAEYGSLAPGRLLELLGRLRAAAMLADPPRALYGGLAERLTPATWGRRVERVLRGALLAERPLPGAGRLARELYHGGGWLLFTRPAPLVLALVALAGLVVYLRQLQRGGFEVVTSGGSFALGFLVFALANGLASLTAETGRALATVHFGREVRAGGLRILLAMPTFYADTRDICLEDRRARLCAAAAGPAALLVSAGAAGLLLPLAPGGLISDFLFKLALLSYGTALFYLNPLVQLDGYVMLSEWLEQPDLRERSLAFVRWRLLGKLQARQRLDRQEQALAAFGVLALAWGGYTAAGGIYLFGWRILAGLNELWGHPNPLIRDASLLGAVVLGAALALAVAVVFVRALAEGLRWAERQGLLAEPRPLAAAAFGGALVLALGALLAPGNAGIYRGLLAPPLLMVVLLYARRVARAYQGALLRWFFNGLAVYAGLVFLAEEVSALQELVRLDPSWAGDLDRFVTLAGPVVCLPFGLLLASLSTSRYRAPLGLLALGIGLYAAHTIAPDRPAAALASAAVGLLAGGVLIYDLLGRRPAARPSGSTPPAAAQPSGDAARLAEALALLVDRLLGDVVAQSGRWSAARLARRFNRLAESAGWGLELHDLRLVKARGRDLLEAGPVYRQALGVLLEEAAVRSGRPFVERSLVRARDALPWDRREVLDAWVLAELPWGRAALGRARAEQADLARFLRRVPLFAGLDEAELRPLLRALQSERAPAGRRIIRQGEPGDTFFLVRSGLVDVLKREAGRRERVVARLGEGDGFGELALLHDQPRSASVRAVTPVELLTLRKADFDRLARERFALLDKLGPALDRERLLAAMPLFGGLAPGELAELAGRLESIDLPPHRVVVRQGEPGDRFYLVRDGRLAVSVVEPGGRVRQVASLGPGEYFGEMALLHDRPRSATVTTLAPTKLLALRKTDFDALLWRGGPAGRDLELVASRRRLDLEAKGRAQ